MSRISQSIFLIGVGFDSIITPIGVIVYGGKESNPVLSGIQSPSLMMTVFILSNLIFVPLMIGIVRILNTDQRFRGYPDLVMGSIGIIRFVCGLSWVIFS